MLQDVENIKGELKVIKKNDQFIVFNTTIKKFTNDGIYVFMQSNFIIVRKIKFSININDFEKLELELIDINNEKDSKIINLENLEKEEFNDLMAQYLMLQGDQVHLVNIAFDKGIVLERTSKRGTDDAPVRFRPEIAFTGYCKAILSNATRSNTAV